MTEYRPGTILFRKYHAGGYAVLTILGNDRLRVHHGHGPDYTQDFVGRAVRSDDHATVTVIYEPPIEYPAGTILYARDSEVTYVKAADGVWHYVALTPPNRLTATVYTDKDFKPGHWTVQTDTKEK